MTPYHDLFSGGWPAVQKEFDTTHPEPEYVVFAFYEYADYSGQAYVIFRDDDKLWLVEGSHCSCNGLERQWEPEETAPAVINEMIVRAVESAQKWGDTHPLATHSLEIMVRLGIDGIGRD